MMTTEVPLFFPGRETLLGYFLFFFVDSLVFYLVGWVCGCD